MMYVRLTFSPNIEEKTLHRVVQDEDGESLHVRSGRLYVLEVQERAVVLVIIRKPRDKHFNDDARRKFELGVVDVDGEGSEAVYEGVGRRCGHRQVQSITW